MVATGVLDLFGGRRKPGQCERGAPQQRLATGRGRGPQPAFLHFRLKKPIDRMLRPRGVPHLGNSRLAHWLETPPFCARFERSSPTGIVRRHRLTHRRRLVARIKCALIHPRDKILDDGIRKRRSILRHFRIRGHVADALDEEAFVCITRNDRRAGVSAFEESVSKIHAQSALLLIRPVTLIALVDQHRPDALLEKINLFWSGRKRGLNENSKNSESNPSGSSRCTVRPPGPIALMAEVGLGRCDRDALRF